MCGEERMGQGVGVRDRAFHRVFFIFLTVSFSSYFTVPVSDNCLFQQRGKCDNVLVFYFSGSGASAEVGRGE